MTSSLKGWLGLLLATSFYANTHADNFMGTPACASCHETEFVAWQGSHHDLAMRHANAETVVGDFDNADVTVHGVTSRFFMRDDRYFVNTDGADGELAEFEILYTYGIDPLQQYLVAFPDGRIQALSLAWDDRPRATGGQRWYHLYPDELISADDELHWTGPQQNWNYMCADCHSTNLVKGYDPKTDTFNSTWSEINVGCEACHGPGESHIAWAAMDEAKRAEHEQKGLNILLHDRRGVSWPIDLDSGLARRAGGDITRREVGVCAACHSRRGLIREGQDGDSRFMDYHTPALLTEGLYHPDGQIQDEVYVWGSYTQSKMHEKGVTCSDCHDPHSGELKASGDNVCAQCHLPAKFAVKDHHGHPEESTGADCLACHMPSKVYMGVDDRRDHSMRVPRPDLSLEFGTPNACSQCHDDRDDAWAAQAFREMFPNPKAPFQHWTRAFDQARAGLPQAEISLATVAGKKDTPAIARATAVLELQNYLSPISGQVIEAALQDESSLVRMAAVRTLEAVPPGNRFALAGSLLRDPVLAVRSEAARLLASTPPNQMSVNDRGAMQLALKDYYDIQELNADRPESRLNLGNLAAEVENAALAERYYREALARNDHYSPAWLNLSELYREQGMRQASMDTLKQGIEKQPTDAGLYHALGLAQVREGDNANALNSLRRAAEMAPRETRFGYVLGVALNSLGQPDQAIAELERTHRENPNDRNVLFALATMERDRGNEEAARGWARAMLQLNPGDDQANQLLEILATESG